MLGTLEGLKSAGNVASFGLLGAGEQVMKGLFSDVGSAASAKANAAAAEAQKKAEDFRKQHQNGDQYLPDPTTGQPKVYPNLLITKGYYGGLAVFYPVGKSTSGVTRSGHYFEEIGWSFGDPSCFSFSCFPPNGTNWETVQTTPKNYKQYEEQIKQAFYAGMPQPTLEDFLLSQQELNQVIANYLAQNLAQNQELTQAVVEALWRAGSANGGLGVDNTQTMVTGSAADRTFVTAPYTPAGSSQAQQTQFQIAPDGTVTASILPRPDLAANTSQAPTRQPIGNNTSASTSQTETQAAKPDAKQEAPDVCAMNPNALMCAGLGSMDYKDIELPQKPIDIALNPLNIFSTTGQCPSPEEFSVLRNKFQFSYQPMCEGALKFRPWLIFLAMIISFLIVKDALER